MEFHQGCFAKYTNGKVEETKRSRKSAHWSEEAESMTSLFA